MLAALALLVGLSSTPAAAQGTDPYGGDPTLPVKGGATGFFRLGRLNEQWVFASPEGNAFWLRAVYNVNPVGLRFPGKYPSRESWAGHVVRRLRSWGFNAIGEYSMVALLPVRAYGNTGSNAEKLPFIRLVRPSESCLTNRWGWAAGPVKDLIEGLDPDVYAGSWAWRGGSLPDFFDPNFEATVRGYAEDRKTDKWTPVFWHKNTPSGLSREPWLIGTATDDADYLWGFKRSTDPHLGWMVAITRPERNESAKHRVRYDDPVVHSKRALRDFLLAKYGTIEALNRAWGSSYTTFDSDGGWPGGQGLLDENGRHPWLATNAQFSEIRHPEVRKDLDGFMERFADRYFGLVAKSLREVTPNHLVLGPATLHDSKVPILRAASRHLDALQIHVSEGRLHEMEPALLQYVYAAFQKPVFLWTTFTSQRDSPLGRCKNVWAEFDQPTQEARGRAYADYLSRLLRFRAADGTGPVIGIDWWSWTDKTSGGECANFGLVTMQDNAYDGKESVPEAHSDDHGLPAGGESARYGDFLGPTRAAHALIRTRLEEASKRASGTTARDSAP